MNRMAFTSALVALAIAVFAAMQASDENDRIEELTSATGDLQRQIEDLNIRLDGALGAEPAPSPLRSEPASSGGPASGGVGLATRKPATPLARLAELEKTVKRQKDLLVKIGEADAASRVVHSLMPKNIYFNRDQAAKALGLDERQKSDMADILDRGKRELKDLYELENDDGETWNEVRMPKMADLGGNSGAIRIAMPDFAKIQAFKKKRIPGSSETFGEAEKRIKEATFANVRRTLPPDKAKTWDGAHKDGLLRDGAMGGFSVSSVVLDTPKK